MATIGQLLIVAILLPGCGGQPESVASNDVGAASVDQRVTAAQADASQRYGLLASQIRVVKAEPVTWSDGSLGCPRPGMLYTQALVPGYRVQLRVGSEVWNYHGSEQGALVLCPAGRAQEPVANSRI